jgi:hypothetical protein
MIQPTPSVSVWVGFEASRDVQQPQLVHSVICTLVGVLTMFEKLVHTRDGALIDSKGVVLVLELGRNVSAYS